jgi:hypothetical protein
MARQAGLHARRIKYYFLITILLRTNPREGRRAGCRKLSPPGNLKRHKILFYDLHFFLERSGEEGSEKGLTGGCTDGEANTRTAYLLNWSLPSST